nr:immunoglobulin light chain junction region [Macaca mulatta]MOV63249.1 immunoglobulin light chain junction region [Macaca mulatta]
CMQALKFPYTF